MMKRQLKFPIAWRILFFTLLAIFLYGFYMITLKFDYNWNFKNTLQYFYYEKTVEILAEDDGVVHFLDENRFRIDYSAGGSKIYDISIEKRQIKDSAIVFTGDLLASHEESGPGLFLRGLFVTLKLSLYSTIFGLLIGILFGLARLSINPLLNWTAMIYIEIIRGTPLLVQLIIIYFMLGSVFRIDSAFFCGVFSLSVFSGAYVAEIIRGGIATMQHGQFEAAASLGLNYFQTMRHIIFPQVLRKTLPALGGIFISLVKDSSLVSITSLTDLTKVGRSIASSTLMVFETWIIVALLYFILTSILSLMVKKLEKKLSVGQK